MSLGHKQALVGIAPVDIEPTVVIADSRSPHVVAMLNTLVPVDVGAAVFGQHGIVVLECSSDDFPVYEVGAVQDQELE